MKLRLFPLLLVSGCGTTSPSSSTVGGSTGPVTTSSTSNPSSESSSRGEVSASSTSDATSSSSGDPPEDIPPGFLNPLDVGSSSSECSFWTEDCPPGEKCMPYASDGGISWNATRCSPIAPDPAGAGEPCTVEGAANSGIDTCELHSICWFVDPTTNEGTCIGMCLGTENTTACPEVDQHCSVNGRGSLALCIPVCDPLSQDCDPGEACYPVGNEFVCAPDVSGDGGGLFEPCESNNACDAGLLCIYSMLAPTVCSPDTTGCCSPACALSDPSCPAGTVCAPWFEQGEGPVGFQDVGVCVGES